MSIDSLALEYALPNEGLFFNEYNSHEITLRPIFNSKIEGIIKNNNETEIPELCRIILSVYNFARTVYSYSEHNKLAEDTSIKTYEKLKRSIK